MGSSDPLTVILEGKIHIFRDQDAPIHLSLPRPCNISILVLGGEESGDAWEPFLV